MERVTVILWMEGIFIFPQFCIHSPFLSRQPIISADNMYSTLQSLNTIPCSIIIIIAMLCHSLIKSTGFNFIHSWFSVRWRDLFTHMKLKLSKSGKKSMGQCEPRDLTVANLFWIGHPKFCNRDGPTSVSYLCTMKNPAHTHATRYIDTLHNNVKSYRSLKSSRLYILVTVVVMSLPMLFWSDHAFLYRMGLR